MQGTHHRSLTMLLVASSLAWASGAWADDGMNLVLFEPATGTTNYFSTNGSRVLEHLQVGGSLTFDFAGTPLRVVTEQGDERTRIIEHQAVMDATVGIGLFDRLELAAALPMVVNQASGDLEMIGRKLNSVTPSGSGNLRIIPKLSLLGNAKTGLGATLLFTASFPTGEPKDFLADAGPTYEPAVAVDWRFAPHGSVGLGAGYRFRQAGEFLNIDLGDQITGGAGFEVPLGSPVLSVVGDVFGAVTTEGERKRSEGESPFQAIAGVRWYGPSRLVFSVGGGAGLNTGFGNPQYRFVASVGIDTPPHSLDPDRDQIAGDDDRCPNEAEDFDGYQDTDGCPDLDHDEDGVLDTVDRCLDQREDRDGFEDDDGCPDPDNDGDKIADGQDACPDEAEDKDGFEDKDGCPDPDNDGDGIADKGDACPDEAEDMDGYEDEDGCPDPFHDRDRDGIADAVDKCPDEPETINGNKDEDGCPDKGIMKVLVTADEIKILDKVFFDTGKATIKKVSFNLLDQVAQTIRANPTIRLIEVAGHTDDVGNDDDNLELSQARAESVARYLSDKGVDAARLKMQGYGETRPLQDIRPWLADPKAQRKHLKEINTARGQNRRVEFRILDQQRTIEKMIEVDDPSAPPPEEAAPAGDAAEPADEQSSKEMGSDEDEEEAPAPAAKARPAAKPAPVAKEAAQKKKKKKR